MSIWNTLAIAPTSDVKAIKKAYAKVVKNHKPEQDPEGYQRVREAFDHALKWAKQNTSEIPEERQETISIDPPVEPVELPPEPVVEDKPATVLFEIPPEQVSQQPPQPSLAQVVDKAVGEMDRILHEDSYVHAIEYVKSLLVSDDFIAVDARILLEEKLFAWASRWNEQFVPFHLFSFLVETFDWHGAGYRPAYRKGLDRIERRIHMGKEHDKLYAMSSGRYVGASTADCRAAKVLVGDYRPRYFYWLILVSSIYPAIKKILAGLQKTIPDIFEHELNTETVHWFLRRQNTYYFTRTHIFMGAIPGMLLAGYLLDLLQAYELSVSGAGFFVVLLCGAPVGAVGIWLLAKGLTLFARNAKPKVHTAYLKALPKLRSLSAWLERPTVFWIMFGLAHIMMACTITFVWPVNLVFILSFTVISIMLLMGYFWPAFINGACVLLSLVIATSGKDFTFNLPGEPVHYGIMMTFYVTYSSFFILGNLPEKLDRITDKYASMVFAFNVSLAIVFTYFLLVLNDLVA